MADKKKILHETKIPKGKRIVKIFVSIFRYDDKVSFICFRSNNKRLKCVRASVGGRLSERVAVCPNETSDTDYRWTRSRKHCVNPIITHPPGGRRPEARACGASGNPFESASLKKRTVSLQSEQSGKCT